MVQLVVETTTTGIVDSECGVLVVFELHHYWKFVVSQRPVDYFAVVYRMFLQLVHVVGR